MRTQATDLFWGLLKINPLYILKWRQWTYFTCQTQQNNVFWQIKQVRMQKRLICFYVLKLDHITGNWIWPFITNWAYNLASCNCLQSGTENLFLKLIILNTFRQMTSKEYAWNITTVIFQNRSKILRSWAYVELGWAYGGGDPIFGQPWPQPRPPPQLELGLRNPLISLNLLLLFVASSTINLPLIGNLGSWNGMQS